MEEINREEAENISGGSASYYIVGFTVKLYNNDTWVHEYPFTLWSHEYVSHVKESLVGSHGITSPDQIRLYRPDGREMTGGSLEDNGICTGNVIKAVY
jgi:hypothetical protein